VPQCLVGVGQGQQVIGKTVTVALIFFIDALLRLNDDQNPVCSIRPAHCCSYFVEEVPDRQARQAQGTARLVPRAVRIVARLALSFIESRKKRG
jgi:hypothetical protein